ncbi:hypothetical protein BJ322DRAFT_1113676 [Thelephora terrestris]|uniref:Uncharacterized protein n=1 Tax=Thelephora terrestris TaxID=56493 RepID=A0A9P6H4M2_9AGAM|nr:hypothetical protein BJ322DRAFT_1113676 [Thelephora terrestris]
MPIMTHPLMVVNPSRSPHQRDSPPIMAPKTSILNASGNGDMATEDHPKNNSPPPEPARRPFSASSMKENDLPPSIREGEYESGRVICEVCEEGVSIRDEETGGFSISKWTAHRKSCATSHVAGPPDGSASSQSRESTPLPPSNSLSAPPVQTQRKKRRPKRSEEERINFFRTDPYVAQFEAYRVLCAGCDKWIRLRSNSSYCSIPWEAHRKSCLAKKGTQKPTLKVETDRRLCENCDNWIIIDNGDGEADAKWAQHKLDCARNVLASAHMAPKRHKTDSPTSEYDRASSHRSRERIELPPLSAISGISSPSIFTTPSHALPTEDTLRLSPEQRAKALRMDPYLDEVEPHRVFCKLCQHWIPLRKDVHYYTPAWQQHRSKCTLVHRDQARDDMDRSNSHLSPISNLFPSHSDEDAHRTKRVKLSHVRGDLSDDETPESRYHGAVDLKTSGGRANFIHKSVGYLFRTTYSVGDEITIASLVTYLNSALPPDKYEDFDTVEVTRAAMALSKIGSYVFEGDVLRPHTPSQRSR